MRGTTCTATWRKRGASYQVIVRPAGANAFYRTVSTKTAAIDLAAHFNRLGLQAVDVAEARRQAEAKAAVSPPQWPRLREALPTFIQLMADQGEWQGSTPGRYLARLRYDVFDYVLEGGGRILGDLRVDEITERMLGELLDATRTGAGARSMAVREQIRCPLKRFYHWLIKKQGFTGPNPAAALRDYMGKAENKRQRKTRPYPYFRRDAAQRVLQAAREHAPRYRAMVGCMMLAGMRYGEAAALEKGDILPEKGAIYLQRAWCEETGRVGGLKNHVSRYVPLPRELAAMLREHLEIVELEGMHAGWTEEQRRLAFPGQRGTIIRHSTFLEHIWRPLLRRAGLPYRKVHALRHSFATWALEGDPASGIPAENILRVRDWMGHASVEETERYAHVNSMGATAALDALSELVSPRGNS
jgi:integrase